MRSLKKKGFKGIEYCICPCHKKHGLLIVSYFMQVANLVGYVIGPSSINSLASRFLNKQGSLLVPYKLNHMFFLSFIY